MKRVYDFLKKCGTYYLATVEGDQPRVRPFGTVDIFEGRLYIQTGKAKKVYQQLKEHPKVELSATMGDTWIRLSATAVEDGRLEAKAHMLAAYPELQAMYKADDGNTAVFYLEKAEAIICSFTKPEMMITF